MKQTGILLAVSSLPAPHGIGDLGPAAFEWIDLLRENGVGVWQLLPLNPTGYGNSPYQPYSSQAGDEIYLSLEFLAAEGLLPECPPPLEARSRVEYESVRTYKEQWLRRAFEAFSPDEAYGAFAEQPWVRDYAVFRAFKQTNGLRSWLEWPEAQRDWPLTRSDAALSEVRTEVAYHTFLQYEFLRQWSAVHKYANDAGIQIMGDVPFYVGIDSVDVWGDRESFLLDKDGRPTFIAGVPPDYFSATGQRWGNPIYDWELLKRTNYDFWVRRIGYNQKLYDIVRVDHFRAFDTFWKIPASCPTAMEGDWIEAPGRAVLDRLRESVPGLRLVAEDLGDLRPEVLRLRDDYELPGMKVLEFAFEAKSKYMFDVLDRAGRQILYTGTHDNATLREWVNSLTPAARRKLRRFLKKEGMCGGDILHRIKLYALRSPAQLAVLPAQDVLDLGEWARMNRPGTLGSPNWEWKLTGWDALRAALRRLRPEIAARSAKGVENHA